MKKPAAEVTIKRLLTTLCFMLLATITSTGVTHAHQVVENDDVTALVHITPDDNPVAGSEDYSEIAFDLDGVSVGDYTFEMKIKLPGGEEENNYSYIDLEDNIVASQYQFSQTGDYQIIVTGTGVDGQKPFSITHDQSVVRSVDDSSIGIIVLISAGAMVVGVSLLATTMVISGDKKSKKKGTKA